jgi:DNA-binding beta-propeller fold protein YncE
VREAQVEHDARPTRADPRSFVVCYGDAVRRTALALGVLLSLTRCEPRRSGFDDARATAAALTVVPTARSAAVGGTAAHSSTIALAQGGRLAWVVQPDGDSISVVDVEARALVREVALGPTPAVDAAGRYVPAVAPRAVAIAARQGRAFVSGERSGEVIALDTVRMEVAARARVCARPVGVVVTADEGAVLVACAADDVVVALDPRSLRERARVAVGPLPWALALDPDPRRAHVAHFHGPGVTTLTLAPLAVAGTLAVPEVAPRGRSTTSRCVRARAPSCGSPTNCTPATRPSPSWTSRARSSPRSP